MQSPGDFVSNDETAQSGGDSQIHGGIGKCPQVDGEFLAKYSA